MSHTRFNCSHRSPQYDHSPASASVEDCVRVIAESVLIRRRLRQRGNVLYFRIYDLRSTYATRLSAGGVSDECVTQLLRQGDAQVFKKYWQMKLQMNPEALQRTNRGLWHSFCIVGFKNMDFRSILERANFRSTVESMKVCVRGVAQPG